MFFPRLAAIGLVATAALPGLVAAWASKPKCPAYTAASLQRILAPGTSITTSNPANDSRWSDYAAPSASLYIQVQKEEDIATIVKYANHFNYDFLVQNGGNGWATTFDLQGCSLLIDISNLNRVVFNHNKTLAWVEGGIRVDELVAAAAGNNTRIATATCNCVGFLGAALGGGLTRTAGLYGWSVDQLLELNVVLASGEQVRVTPETQPDLWWALGGAGPNFGIVTSALVKAYPVPEAENIAWQGNLVYTGDKITAVMQAINDLELTPQVQVDFDFFTTGAPDYTPLIGVVPFYIGDAAGGRAAFNSFFELGPLNSSTTGTVPYAEWNAAGNSFCTKGSLKPTYGASMTRIDPTTWTQVFQVFSDFVASNPTVFGNSAVVAENYPTAKADAIGSATSSFPWRSLGHYVLVSAIYEDPKYNDVANAFGAKVRDLWWSTAGTSQNASYINFAHGDDALSAVYGSSLPRLQHLKRVYDPFNRFGQWFPL